MTRRVYLEHDVNLNSRPVITDVDHVVASNLIGQRGPARRLSASQTQGLGMRLAHMLTQSGSGRSGGTYGRQSLQCESLVFVDPERQRCACCGRSRTQRLRDTMVTVHDGIGMEVCSVDCACVIHWIVPLTSQKAHTTVHNPNSTLG